MWDFDAKLLKPELTYFYILDYNYDHDNVLW